MYVPLWSLPRSPLLTDGSAFLAFSTFPLPARPILLRFHQRVTLLMTWSPVSQAALVRCELELLAQTTQDRIVYDRLSGYFPHARQDLRGIVERGLATPGCHALHPFPVHYPPPFVVFPRFSPQNYHDSLSASFRGTAPLPAPFTRFTCALLPPSSHPSSVRLCPLSRLSQPFSHRL